MLVGLLGCGRLGFDASGSGSDAMDGALAADAPALPATLLCSARRISIPSVGPSSALAVEWNGAAFTAMWLDHGAVVGVSLDPSLTSSAPAVLVPGPVEDLAAIRTNPSGTLFTTATAGTQMLWSSSSLASATVIRTEPSLVGRASVVTDATGVPRLWVRGTATGIAATYLNSSGALGVQALIPTGTPVVALAAADNSNHAHMTWREDLAAGISRCTQADLLFTVPAAMLGASAQVSDDCFEPRIDSGPAVMDSILTTWRTSAHAVQMRYHGGSVDVSGILSMHGRAPRPRFDGTQFWVAWIDEPPAGDRLRIALVDEALGGSAVDVPGWVPASDAAYELVRGADAVYLFILGADTLSILKTCP